MFAMGGPAEGSRPPFTLCVRACLKLWTPASDVVTILSSERNRNQLLRTVRYDEPASAGSRAGLVLDCRRHISA